METTRADCPWNTKWCSQRNIQLVCDDSNIFKWTALIKGPCETPFEGGVFQLTFAIPEQYPLYPPQVRF